MSAREVSNTKVATFRTCWLLTRGVSLETIALIVKRMVRHVAPKESAA